MDDDNFAGGGTLPVAEDEAIHAVGQSLHGIVVGIGRLRGVQFEVVDNQSSGVEHLYVDLALHVAEAQFHLTVVGIGDDTHRGWIGFLFLNTVE